MNLPNLKICGITTRETARFCAETGVGALGAVFFRKSPRYVTAPQARGMFEALPTHVARVGVFVNASAEEMISIAREADLDTVQMHGSETLSDMLRVEHAGFHVVNVIAAGGEKLIQAACALPESIGILVECGHGPLPGGNGAEWRWAEASPLARFRPFAVAGGLTPENFREAANASQAHAWDVSSGVETAPGIKSHDRIRKLVETAITCPPPPFDFFWKGRNPTPSRP